MKITKIDNNPFHSMPYRSSGRNEIRYNRLPFYFAYTNSLPKGVNSIVVTSDLQGRDIKDSDKLLGESFIDEITILEELNIIPQSPIILSCGDLYDRPELNKLGATGDVTPVLNRFSSHFSNVIAVHGNHDIINKNELHSEVIVLDGNVVNKLGIRVSGVCGITGKPKKNQRKTKEDFLNTLKKACNHNSDIIMLHQSPKGTLSDQIGNEETADLLSKMGSSLIVSGHCYWENSLTTIGKNQVLNTDSKVYVIREE